MDLHMKNTSTSPGNTDRSPTLYMCSWGSCHTYFWWHSGQEGGVHVRRLEGRWDPWFMSWTLKICLPCHLFCSPIKSYSANGLKAEIPDMYFTPYLFSAFLSSGVFIAKNFILCRLSSLMLFRPSVGMQSTYKLYRSSACVFLRKLSAETTLCANTRGSSARNNRQTRGTQYWHGNNGALPGKWKQSLQESTGKTKLRMAWISDSSFLMGNIIGLAYQRSNWRAKIEDSKRQGAQN